MNTTAKLAIAGLLAAAFSSVALAQAQVGGGASGAQGGGAGAGAQLGAGAAAGAATDTLNYGEVISSLRAGGDASSDIAALDDTATVRIILLSELRGQAAENAQGLDQALASNDGIDELRSAIDANATLKSKLEAEGHTAEDVVAVSTGAGGEVTLVVDG